MEKLKRLLLWLRRCGYSRGFGIQSPWAYQFVRYVINEHYPYYSYETLKKVLPEMDWLERKMSELYFRLANFRQPRQILYYGNDLQSFTTYCKNGCNRSDVLSVDKSTMRSIPAIEMLCVNSLDDYQEIVESALPLADSNSMMVIENLYKSKDSRKFWQRIVSDDRTGIVFDLYYCGIIFFDKKRYKEKYIINF